ncbi:hypothetical protein, partial [Streptomyces triticirhizae]
RDALTRWAEARRAEARRRGTPAPGADEADRTRDAAPARDGAPTPAPDTDLGALTDDDHETEHENGGRTGTAHAPARGAPDAPPDPDDDPDDDHAYLDPDDDPAAAPAAGAAPTPVQWEGESRAGLSRGATLALLVCLALVELPIYWTAFRRLHGVGDASSNLLTATFTLAVGTVMIVVPHILGRLLRSLPATGAPRMLRLPGIALLAAWVYACWVLGDLRASLLAEEREPYLANPEDAAFLSPEQRQGTSVLEELNIGEQTMTLMFVSLLLLSGGVAFLLGLSLAHPYLAAYRATFDARRRLATAEGAAFAAAHRAAERAEAHRDDEAARDAARDAALREVDDLYEAAAHAYVDGLASAARDPAVTEAAIRLSGTWPLLPRATPPA